AHYPKVSLHHTDGFKFFTRTRTPLDVVVSEPENPWVAGVENLFTPDFYELVASSLKRDGVFVQWVQLYELSPDLLSMILSNVTQVFPNARLLLIGAADVAIVASMS